jgi:hypothetical protein
MLDFLPACVEQTLRSADPPSALYELVKSWRREGYSKEEIYDSLIQFIDELRRSPTDREADEDIVMEVMDALTGWCHKDYWIE